eukprot:gene27174-30717_t
MTDSNAADENWLLDEDEEEAPAVGVPAPDQRLWRVLIVDDDVDVHAVTRLALRNVSFKGRELELFSAYSGREAYDILRDTPDIALVLLDVVMETDDAGLLLALSIGAPTITKSPDGLTVTASAAAVHLKVTLGGFIDVAELDLFPMTATAKAPAGGVTCGDATGTDTDGDGLTDTEETTGSQNPFPNPATNPNDADSDNDGINDGTETDIGTNPNDADTDDDGLLDGQETTGSENDFPTPATDPLDPDSDNDGLTDGQETSGSENDAFGNEPTNPNSPDTDGDGLTDTEEVTGSENDAN